MLFVSLKDQLAPLYVGCERGRRRKSCRLLGDIIGPVVSSPRNGHCPKAVASRTQSFQLLGDPSLYLREVEGLLDVTLTINVAAHLPQEALSDVRGFQV